MDERTLDKRMPKSLAGLGRLVDAGKLRAHAEQGVKLMQSTKTYSAEARKGMAILVLAVVLLLLCAYLVFAWQSAAAERLQQASAEHALVAARAAKAAREGATRLTSATDVTPMFLSGDTPGVSAAKFQEDAGDAAARAGLAVKRMQLLETGDEQAGTPYRISVDAEGGIEQLRAFLADVEGKLPLMFVTGLEVQPAAEEGASDGYPSEALRISLRIEGYGWRTAP